MEISLSRIGSLIALTGISGAASYCLTISKTSLENNKRSETLFLKHQVVKEESFNKETTKRKVKNKRDKKDPTLAGTTTLRKAIIVKPGEDNQLQSAVVIVSKIPQAITFDVSTDLEEEYKGKILDLIKPENKAYLLKPYDKKNEELWNNAFTNRYLKKKTEETGYQFHDLFKNITSGYSTNPSDKTALNQACKEALKKEKSDYKFSDTDYLLKNISDFCTKDSKERDVSEPKAVLYSEINESGLLSVKNNKDKLVSSKEENKLWWEWSYNKWKTAKNTTLDNSFKGLTSAFAETTAKGKITALNQACEAAYKKAPKDLISIETNLFKNIREYCSVLNKKDDLIFPNWNEPTIRKLLSEDKATQINGDLIKNQNNKNYLVDSTQETTGKSWWAWSYQTRYIKDKKENFEFPELFNNISIGYSSLKGNESAALNQVCKTAYQKSKEELEADNRKLLNSIERYCAIGNFDSEKPRLTLN